MRTTDHESARKMALRAAKAVSFGVAAFTAGCTGAHEPGDVEPGPEGTRDPGLQMRGGDPDDQGVPSSDGGRPGARPDAAPRNPNDDLPTVVEADAGSDDPTVVEGDAGSDDGAIAVLDAGVSGDAMTDGAVHCEYPTFGEGVDPEEAWRKYSECCDQNGWAYELGCFAWGPFVPPSETV